MLSHAAAGSFQDPNCVVQATILFKYLIAGNSGTWNVSSLNASWRFYDHNAGSSNKTAWFLEIEAADIDVLVSDTAEMQTDLEALTATFYDPETACVCKLKFPTIDVCRDFCDVYQNKLYENMSSQGVAELGTAGDWFFRPADVEPMDWDPTPDAPPLPEVATPKRWHETEALNDPSQAVHSVAMGAGDNSFLVQQGRISVLKNEYGGIRTTGRGFSLTPPPRTPVGLGENVGTFMPGKTILAKAETQMNMLTPDRREAVVQVHLLAPRPLTPPSNPRGNKACWPILSGSQQGCALHRVSSWYRAVPGCSPVCVTTSRAMGGALDL
jgi:hypothetical protein